MTENEKIEILELILGASSSEGYERRKEEILKTEEGRVLWDKYSKTKDIIELQYLRRVVSDGLKDHSIDSLEDQSELTNGGKSEIMKTNSNNWIQYPIMILVSIIISWLVFSVLGRQKTESDTNLSQTEAVEPPVEKEVDNILVTDEVKKETEIMGLALNRTGFYILPYSVSELKGVFGSVGEMTNKLPLSIIWDDAEYGLSIANFSDKNFEKLSGLPYQFSKSDYFLGEELFFVFSTESEVKINKGFVIEDDAAAYKMKVHLSLPSDVYGAVVINKAGLIVGISDLSEDKETVTVIKSNAIISIIKDMNLDKGVSYISLPSQNYLRNKSNAQRIESLKPFVAWYSTK